VGLPYFYLRYAFAWPLRCAQDKASLMVNERL